MSWQSDFIELKKSGRRSDAIALLLSESNAGNLAAQVRLAIEKNRDEGSDTEVDFLIKDALTRVHDDDSEVHWLLSLAFDLSLGDFPYEEKAKLSFRHLKLAALNSNNPADAIAVASHYHYGSLAVKIDYVKAKEWYELALEQGDVEAQVYLDRLNRDCRKSNS